MRKHESFLRMTSTCDQQVVARGGIWTSESVKFSDRNTAGWVTQFPAEDWRAVEAGRQDYARASRPGDFMRVVRS